MRAWSITALAMLSIPAAMTSSPPPRPSVSYALVAEVEHDSLRSLQVQLQFDGEADGETLLRLPNEWGGEVELWKCLRDLAVHGGNARLEQGEDVWHRRVIHDPGATITVGYRLVQDWDGVPTAGGGNLYRPAIQPGYFHLIGDAVFVTPEWDSSTPAAFQPPSLPAGWSFASDLEHQRNGGPLRLHDIIESVTVGGDFRVLRRPARNGRLRLAIRGDWEFSDDQLADKLQRIVRSHRRFFDDPDEPFLVTVLPLVGAQGSSSLGGTGRSDAFAFFATANSQEATLNRILAHEHLHTWIPRRIGGMPQQDEPADYWLSEGFTDFYAFRLLVRDGLWSVDDFLEATNEVLQRYAQSSARTEPNRRVVADFWNDPDVQALPYQRGFLLAAIWDHRLRQASRGRRDLDDVLHAMKRAAARDARKAESSGPGETSLLASQRFVQAMRDAGVDPTPELQAHVERGEPIHLPADLLAPSAQVETVEQAEFTRGFDPAATSAAGNVVTGVDAQGPAYAAGLRDGMRILERVAGRPGDSSVALEYRVQDGDQERRIRYQPEGTRRFTQQRVRLTEGADPAARGRLVRRIAGR